MMNAPYLGSYWISQKLVSRLWRSMRCLDSTALKDRGALRSFCSDFEGFVLAFSMDEPRAVTAKPGPGANWTAAFRIGWCRLRKIPADGPASWDSLRRLNPSRKQRTMDCQYSPGLQIISRFRRRRASEGFTGLGWAGGWFFVCCVHRSTPRTGGVGHQDRPVPVPGQALQAQARRPAGGRTDRGPIRDR